MGQWAGGESRNARKRIEHALGWLQSGNPPDVERAIAVLQGAVYGFGMNVCGNPADAEDTAQETLVRLARSLKKFPNMRALSVWLYKVAKSQCLMSRRKSRFAPEHMLSLEELMPQPGHDGADVKSWEIDPERATLQGEFRDRLQQAIQALPTPYRPVLILRDMEELSTREVAEVMDLSEDTVKMRRHRARLRAKRAGQVSSPGGRGITMNAMKHKDRMGGRSRPSRREIFAALSEFLDGTLPVRTCRELERHLRSCKPCIVYLETLKKTIAACRAYRVPPAPLPSAEVREAIKRAIWRKRLPGRRARGESSRPGNTARP